MNTVSFMSANYVARESGYAIGDWGEGDRATNDAFRPVETFRERFDELLLDIRELGFEALDVWGAHLNPEWATDEQLAIARELLDRHGLAVASFAGWFGREHAQRACEIADAIGTDLAAGPLKPDLAPLLAARGVRLAIENHPERTPRELLEKAGAGAGVAVDTGWWATHGYDPARAIEELGNRILHVHLKDVRAPGAHEVCPWGEGCVAVEECVRALLRIGYQGPLSVEYSPADRDPGEACRAMLADLRGWLG